MPEVRDALGLDWVWKRSAQTREWILLTGNRGVLGGLIFLAIVVVLAGVAEVSTTVLSDTQPLFYVYGGLISGNLTIITVVVSINQLLLSRELMSPPELRTEIEGVIDYRNTLEESAGRVAPVDPLGFLTLLVENTRQTAQRLGGLTRTEAPEAYDAIDDTVETVTANVDEIDRLLTESDTSTFEVLSTTLTTNYAQDINGLRQLRREYGDDLPDEVYDTIEDLIHRLQDIDVARQYFKSIYLQQELASVSRLLFYVGLPTELVLSGALLVFTTGPPPLAGGDLSLFVAVTVAVGLAPIVVLFVFILRTATVTTRTAARVPFTTPSQEK
jgi:hypothetical protein